MRRLLLLLVFLLTHALAATSVAAERPNVLFLAVDDMNDWIGCLEGTPPMVRPRAITPNLDRLADRGVNFTNAHTAGVFCAPSRAAIFTGQFATTTGCYKTPNYFTNRPEIEGLQMSFQKAGYTTLGAGKLFHHPAGAIDQRGWNEFFLRNASQRENGWPLDSWSAETPFPKPFPASIYNRGKKVTGGLFLEWGAIPDKREEEMADTIRVNWAVEQLKKKHDKPFFLACGIYAPHFPNYCPQKYFDLYKPEDLTLPAYKEDDAEDLPEKARRRMNGRRKLHHEPLEKLDAIDDAIHGYLACISYADAMMGRVLDALEASPYADNTIVVLWSDHGYHQGQKGQWGKHTLWERTSNVPFIWAGPGVAEKAKTDVTVSLIDMYPTFVDMCQLPEPTQKLEGISLADTLADPSKAEDRDVLLPYSEPGAYAIINRDWRYIHYADETEELYDLQKDPDEWNNLAGKEGYAKQLSSLKALGPKTFAEPEKAWNARKDLVVEGESFRWEEGAGNATSSSGYVPPVTAREPSKKKAPISRKAAYAVLSPATKGPKKAKPEGIAGRVVTGYQGWFRAEGDGTGMRFHHYENQGKFEPGKCSIDLWPDLSEFPKEERFPTAFKHADGKVAEVFSSIHPGTVDRHFRWMADYGIDGAFVQRFATHGAKPRKDSRSLLWENEKLKLCRDAAIRNDRCWILMYDLTGLTDDDFPRLAEDWKNLRRRMKLGIDPNDTAYLQMNGKPLVAIWGVGFGNDRGYSLEKAEWFIRLLKNNPDWGGMSIMLGTPYFWREQRRDATEDKRLHQVLKLADIISPWSVGRYRGKPDEMKELVTQQRLDREWGATHGIETLPVIFPGFSWKNLKGPDTQGIPRRKGAFLWEQFLATAAAGNKAAYIAMFDEVDEATAIFKCTNNPPVGASPFQTYEGLPSDHYLKLAGKGGRLLRGKKVEP